jgi:L-fucose mutarotase/ribose pyranase (RbsD/FucU family)
MHFIRCSACLLLVAAACGADWQDRLRGHLAERLPVLGHRNWIVIADSAYPLQSRPGIETIHVGGDQLAAVREALAACDAAKHVRPEVFVDAELSAVDERDAPGVTAYRDGLAKDLGNRPVERLAHEQIITELDKAAETFRVVIIKTDGTIPYTSVFLRLNCGYWNGDAEKRLRAALQKP